MNFHGAIAILCDLEIQNDSPTSLAKQKVDVPYVQPKKKTSRTTHLGTLSWPFPR